MRARYFISTAILAALITPAAPAMAADVFGPLRGTQYGGPAMTPVTSWEGGYFGGFAGLTNVRANAPDGFKDFLDHELRLNAFANNTGIANWIEIPDRRNQGGSFGFFAGYNYQIDEAVLGVEFDYSRSNRKAVASDSLARVTSLDGLFGNEGSLEGESGAVTMSGESKLHLRDLMTLRARAGYTIGSMLPFVTGGLALANYTRTYTATRNVRVVSGPETGNTFTQTYGPERKSGFGIGLAAGAGVDVGVTENLFVRGEWQYLHFNDLGGIKADINNFRAGAAVKF